MKRLFKVWYKTKWAVGTDDLTQEEIDKIRKHPDTRKVKILSEYDLTELVNNEQDIQMKEAVDDLRAEEYINDKYK